METNVFVKFLPADITNDKLFSLFSPFGGIVSVKVMVNASSGASLGYGFVRFRNNESAMRAISAMTGYKLGNKVLLCKLSDYFNFNDPCANLYIKPLPLEFREEQLREMFSKFGPIQTTKILRFEANSDSNIGFVRYENVESASQAIHELNGFIFAGHVHPLIVKYAESDSQRAMRKANTLPKPAQQASLYNSGELTPPPPQAYPPMPQVAYNNNSNNNVMGYEGNHVEQCGCAYCSGKAPLWLPAQTYTVPAWAPVPSNYYFQQSNEYGSDNEYQDNQQLYPS